MTSPAHDVSPSISTDYTYDSELDIADAVPLAFQRSVSFPRGTMVTYITWDVLRWGAENLSLAASDGSRLWHGDITSPFPPSGNEGYVCNRDVPYLSVTLSYVDDDIRGLWEVPQPEPRHNPMVLHMLTSSHVTDCDRFEKPVIQPVCWPPPWLSWLPRQAWPSTPGPIWQWPQHPREAAPPNLHPRRTIAHSPMLQSTSDLPGAHRMNCWQPRRADQRNHSGAEWDICCMRREKCIGTQLARGHLL